MRIRVRPERRTDWENRKGQYDRLMRHCIGRWASPEGWAASLSGLTPRQSIGCGDADGAGMSRTGRKKRHSGARQNNRPSELSAGLTTRGLAFHLLSVIPSVA